jgi:hypothetical protein
MNEQAGMTSALHRRDFVSLCLAVLTVATVGFSLWACGGDDLTFPGQIPPTTTPSRTETPDETETPEDEEPTATPIL